MAVAKTKKKDDNIGKLVNLLRGFLRSLIMNLLTDFYNSKWRSRKQKRRESLRKKNYWADNSYYSDLEVTIYSQWFDYKSWIVTISVVIIQNSYYWSSNVDTISDQQ